jgi:hypothetical protein
MYSKVQFIAYDVNTLPKRIGGGKSYLGIWDGTKDTETNAKLDIEKRCAVMADAIAVANDKAIKDSNTLKLFMAPEFYFRGTKGAYPVECLSHVMETMRATTGKATYNDWLFVFGTALGYLELDSGVEVFNVAMVQKGGLTFAATGLFDVIVYKEYVSSVDFIGGDRNTWNDRGKRTVDVAGGVQQVFATEGSVDAGGARRRKTTNPQGKGSEQSKSGLGGQSIFEIDDITFALEICLDHYEARVKKSPQKSGSKQIQLHLVSAGGAEIVEDSVACVTNGYVFYVDGDGSTPEARKRTGRSTFEPLAAIAKDAIATKTDASALFVNATGMIRPFPAVAIPAAVSVR